jgi:hypothetical protein
MIKLNLCRQDPKQDFDSIVEDKESPRHEVLKNVRPRVFQAYNAHVAARPALESLVPLGLVNPEKEALLHCYTSPTRSRDAMMTCILNSQSSLAQATCQYCRINAPKTFDHYLPQSIFAEFAVYSHNLIPCCGDCNRIRGDAWLERGERQHIHLYFDDIDNQNPVLTATIDYTTGVPSASFELAPGQAGETAFFKRLTSHFNQLQLFTRYKSAAPPVLSEWHSDILRNSTRFTPSIIQAEFADKLVHDQQRLGSHHWKVALLRAVSRSLDFIDFVCTKPLSIWEKKEGIS